MGIYMWKLAGQVVKLSHAQMRTKSSAYAHFENLP